MANMDDYSRAKNQAKESGETTEAALGVNNNSENDDDDLTGTRDDVDAALNRANSACEPARTPAAAETDSLYHLFDGDGSDIDESTSELTSNLPVFPNVASAISSSSFHGLLGTVAQTTASVAVESRRHISAVFAISLGELQRFVNDTLNDETEPHRSEPFGNVRPTEVIALLENELENVCEWSPLPPQPPPNNVSPSPPLRSYASIMEVSRAFTLNHRRYRQKSCD
ncbi:hypothetical protein L917_04143 [Phytophthora nicotianae]|uniref:Uncharacterized protein n=1 Tax=Phytophthora nicotianae TaxID=4792 RepID=W2LMX8_PHYNI|nr:hypothetical protein L915_04304 [Phytophthora nicotianae]ETL98858.1 hypothetical protein L917_04143 [Phytophthora nicotianae]